MVPSNNYASWPRELKRCAQEHSRRISPKGIFFTRIRLSTILRMAPIQIHLSLKLQAEGLSISAIARKLDVSANTVRQWLNGSPVQPKKPAARVRDKTRLMEIQAEWAAKNGGRLKEGQTYIDSSSKLWFVREDGTEFQAIPYMITQGFWRKKDPPRLERAHAVATANNGFLLSSEITRSIDVARWRCAVGHEWDAKYTKVVRPGGKKGTWCPHCLNNATYTPQEGLRRCHEKAVSMGGRFLSPQWNTATAMYSWECKLGHTWDASFGNVFHSKNPTWCPTCATQNCISEAKTRSIVEQLFGAPFPSVKPTWLKSARGGNLELDGFCAALNVAFEYQGAQHYRVVSLFKNAEKLAVQQENDEKKKQLCAARGVVLLEVSHEISDTDIPLAIFTSAARHPHLLKRIELVAAQVGHTWNTQAPISLKNGPHTHAVFKNDASLYTDKLAVARTIAKDRGGEFLSTSWLGARSAYQWRCGSCANEWSASYDNVRRGTWCNVCSIKKAGLTRRSDAAQMIAECQALAANKGGQFLSTDWARKHDKLQWQCDQGHAWIASYFDIKRGSWCRRCARKKVALEMWETRSRTNTPRVAKKPGSDAPLLHGDLSLPACSVSS